jgi:hypothetical protein
VSGAPCARYAVFPAATGSPLHHTTISPVVDHGFVRLPVRTALFYRQDVPCAGLHGTRAHRYAILAKDVNHHSSQFRDSCFCVFIQPRSTDQPMPAATVKKRFCAGLQDTCRRSRSHRHASLLPSTVLTQWSVRRLRLWCGISERACTVGSTLRHHAFTGTCRSNRTIILTILSTQGFTRCLQVVFQAPQQNWICARCDLAT